MNNIDADSSAAKDHPLIKQFVDLVEETVSDGVLDFTHLRNKAFMKFLSNFVIYRYEEDMDDFRVVMFGSYVTTALGIDHTGNMLSKMEFGGESKNIYNANKRIINGENRVYVSNTIFWQNREYKKSYQVKVPLQRNGSINEVLVCVDIE